MSQNMNVVWFKKDLRVFDHAPLSRAIQEGPTLGLFVFEDEWLNSEEFSELHFNFANECIAELKIELQKINVPLIIAKGTMIDILSDLNRKYKVAKLYSHQETGQLWTFDRDKKVKSWCQTNSIPWVEFKQHGIVRKLKDRDTWNIRREKIINRPLVAKPYQSIRPTVEETLFLDSNGSSLLGPFPEIKSEAPCSFPDRQRGGRTQGLSFLETFLSDRSQIYMQSLSSPVTAFDHCSRISPYITWGALSMSEVHRRVSERKQLLGSSLRELQNAKSKKTTEITELKSWYRSLMHFENRLWWRCHFMQKLETEPEIEFRNFNKKFDQMRESEFDQSKFEAWCKGETGFPMIDASMRALKKHGWINFRMRAMLVSFASYQLWLHWKKPSQHLARLFIDFEPGIHYSQMQMQSGVTGINAIRIYSPQKQAEEHDPQGVFIKYYLPELQIVPEADLAEPHLLPPLLQSEYSFRIGETYPYPIVDPKESYDIAKKRIFEWRSKIEVKKASVEVLQKHASRANPHFPVQKRWQGVK